MSEKTLTNISFGSYLKLCSIILMVAGMVWGVLAVIAYIVGGDVVFMFGQKEVTGIAAAVINFFFGPIAGALAGVLYGVLSYLPFKFLLGFVGGFKLKIEVK